MSERDEKRGEGDEFGVKMTLEMMAKAARLGQPLPLETPGGEMDADQIAVFLAGLLMKSGAKTRFAAVAERPDAPFHHVFVEVFYPPGNVWLPVDPWQARQKWAREVVHATDKKRS